MNGLSPVWKIDDKIISTRSFLYNQVLLSYSMRNFDETSWLLRSLVHSVRHHFKKDVVMTWLSELSSVSKGFNSKKGSVNNRKADFRDAVNLLDLFLINFFDALNQKKLLEQLERDPLEEAGSLE